MSDKTFNLSNLFDADLSAAELEKKITVVRDMIGHDVKLYVEDKDENANALTPALYKATPAGIELHDMSSGSHYIVNVGGGIRQYGALSDVVEISRDGRITKLDSEVHAGTMLTPVVWRELQQLFVHATPHTVTIEGDGGVLRGIIAAHTGLVHYTSKCSIVEDMILGGDDTGKLDISVTPDEFYETTEAAMGNLFKLALHLQKFNDKPSRFIVSTAGAIHMFNDGMYYDINFINGLTPIVGDGRAHSVLAIAEFTFEGEIALVR